MPAPTTAKGGLLCCLGFQVRSHTDKVMSHIARTRPTRLGRMAFAWVKVCFTTYGGYGGISFRGTFTRYLSTS